MSISMEESLTELRAGNVQALSSNAVSLKSTIHAPAMLMNMSLEPEITVDMDSRVVTVPDELKTIGVVYDNNAETVYIRIPSVSFDDIDLSDKTAYIEFINANGAYYTYEAQKTVEDDTIKLGWTIENNVTAKAGTVQFQVTFELEDDYKWSTLPSSFNVLGGLNISKTVSSSDTNLLTSIIDRTNEAIRTANSNADVVKGLSATIEYLQGKIEQIVSDVNYLKNHVMYIYEEDEGNE